MTCVMYFFGYKSFDVVKIKNVLLNLSFPSGNSFLNFAELTKLGFEYFLKQFQRCKKKLFLQRVVERLPLMTNGLKLSLGF